MSKLVWTQNANDASAEDDREEGIERRDKKIKELAAESDLIKPCYYTKKHMVNLVKSPFQQLSTEDIRSEKATPCNIED